MINNPVIYKFIDYVQDFTNHWKKRFLQAHIEEFS